MIDLKKLREDINALPKSVDDIAKPYIEEFKKVYGNVLNADTAEEFQKTLESFDSLAIDTLADFNNEPNPFRKNDKVEMAESLNGQYTDFMQFKRSIPNFEQELNSKRNEFREKYEQLISDELTNLDNRSTVAIKLRESFKKLGISSIDDFYKELRSLPDRNIAINDEIERLKGVIANQKLAETRNNIDSYIRKNLEPELKANVERLESLNNILPEIQSNREVRGAEQDLHNFSSLEKEYDLLLNLKKTIHGLDSNPNYDVLLDYINDYEGIDNEPKQSSDNSNPKNTHNDTKIRTVLSDTEQKDTDTQQKEPSTEESDELDKVYNELKSQLDDLDKEHKILNNESTVSYDRKTYTNLVNSLQQTKERFTGLISSNEQKNSKYSSILQRLDDVQTEIDQNLESFSSYYNEKMSLDKLDEQFSLFIQMDSPYTKSSPVDQKEIEDYEKAYEALQSKRNQSHSYSATLKPYQRNDLEQMFESIYNDIDDYCNQVEAEKTKYQESIQQSSNGKADTLEQADDKSTQDEPFFIEMPKEDEKATLDLEDEEPLTEEPLTSDGDSKTQSNPFDVEGTFKLPPRNTPEEKHTFDLGDDETSDASSSLDGETTLDVDKNDTLNPNEIYEILKNIPEYNKLKTNVDDLYNSLANLKKNSPNTIAYFVHNHFITDGKKRCEELLNSDELKKYRDVAEKSSGYRLFNTELQEYLKSVEQLENNEQNDDINQTEESELGDEGDEIESGIDLETGDEIGDVENADFEQLNKDLENLENNIIQFERSNPNYNNQTRELAKPIHELKEQYYSIYDRFNKCTNLSQKQRIEFGLNLNATRAKLPNAFWVTLKNGEDIDLVDFLYEMNILRELKIYNPATKSFYAKDPTILKKFELLKEKCINVQKNLPDHFSSLTEAEFNTLADTYSVFDSLTGKTFRYGNLKRIYFQARDLEKRLKYSTPKTTEEAENLQLEKNIFIKELDEKVAEYRARYAPGPKILLDQITATKDRINKLNAKDPLTDSDVKKTYKKLSKIYKKMRNAEINQDASIFKVLENDMEFVNKTYNRGSVPNPTIKNLCEQIYHCRRALIILKENGELSKGSKITNASNSIKQFFANLFGNAKKALPIGKESDNNKTSKKMPDFTKFGTTFEKAREAFKQGSLQAKEASSRLRFPKINLPKGKSSTKNDDIEKNNGNDR